MFRRTPKQGLPVLHLALMSGSAVAAWQVQEWRYGKHLADQAQLYQSDLTTISNAASAQIRADQARRLALEKTLADADQTHSLELSNAQRAQNRLRGSLATAELRLSVLLDATPSANGWSMPATPTTGGVVHGGQRAQLDSAHAQRIIGITHAGDQGLIALRACQAYVKAVSTQK